MVEFTIKTKAKREIVDITERVNEALRKDTKETGMAHLFVLHTTAALMMADLDPGGTDKDYLDAFEKIGPHLPYRHPHDPAHMPDHILSSLIGTSLSIPVKGGQLILGTWQRVVLVELDGPRERRVILSL
jgi:secondary thiamine-phosphate synthase enzyme